MDGSSVYLEKIPFVTRLKNPDEQFCFRQSPAAVLAHLLERRIPVQHYKTASLCLPSPFSSGTFTGFVTLYVGMPKITGKGMSVTGSVDMFPYHHEQWKDPQLLGDLDIRKIIADNLVYHGTLYADSHHDEHVVTKVSEYDDRIVDLQEALEVITGKAWSRGLIEQQLPDDLGTSVYVPRITSKMGKLSDEKYCLVG